MSLFWFLVPSFLSLPFIMFFRDFEFSDSILCKQFLQIKFIANIFYVSVVLNMFDHYMHIFLFIIDIIHTEKCTNNNCKPSWYFEHTQKVRAGNISLQKTSWCSFPISTLTTNITLEVESRWINFQEFGEAVLKHSHY